MQNLQRASENDSFSMQSTPTPATELLTETSTPDDLWNIWPYCWAIDGWEFARERFHRFHTKRFVRKLLLSNRRRQQEFWARFQRDWNREQSAEECEMKLV